MTVPLKIKEQILDIIKQNLDNFWDYVVFLFWSRASWTNNTDSDYDIWIIWKEKIPFLVFLKIKRELNELPLVVDFVDFSVVNDEVFRDLALKNIVKWN